MCGIIERTNIWLAGGEGSHYTAAATATSSLSFREDAVDVIIWAPAEVRRCRFIDPAAAALAPIRLVGDIRVPDSPPDIELVVDDRGRVDDAASFGNDDPPFRDALCGVPDARFLHKKQNKKEGHQHNQGQDSHIHTRGELLAYRFLITSVFSDSGRTTPCSF